MKSFKLKKISYKNIMSVGQQPIVIQLDKVQKTLITGKNGGGKSSLIEAITFALYGKPFRDITKGQLINTYNKKELYVELELEFNGKIYTVKRGQKPTVFEIHVDGVKLDESASAKDFQEYFEEIIGINYNSFKQVVVLGTAGYTPFMALSKPNRRKLVEDLLEVTVLAEIDKLNKAEIRDINQNIQVLDMKADHTRTEIKTHQDYAEKQKKLSGDNLKRLQDMYEQQVESAKTSKAEYIKLTDDLKNITLPENPTNLVQSKMNILTEVKTTQLGYKHVLALYTKGGTCQTCLQQLSDDSLITKVKQKHDELEQSITQASQDVRIAKDQLEQYNQLNSELNAIRSKQEQMRASMEKSVENAKKVKSAISQAQSEFIDNSDKITELQGLLNNILDEKSNLVMDKYRRGIIVEMLKDSGIKSAIVKKYIPFFNKQINHYLKIMGADYSFNLDEEFTETIKSRGREAFSYASFSQGEKARIDIALLFTWRDVASKVTGVKISTLILDEVADSATDHEGVKAIQSILDNDKDLHSFIISHRDHNPQDYGQHIKMKKVGRFTRLDV